MNVAKGFTDGLLAKGKNVLDAIFPPEKRAALLAKIQAFAVNNPKLSAFLLSNIALTGLPLLMFITFTITVFVFSLVVALLIALLVALLFTVFMVGVALIVVLPTVFLTTMGASFIFLWGMGGYYILKWFGEPGGGADGEAIGDKLNNLTGGRLGFLMDGARESAVPDDHLHGGPKYEEKEEKGEKGSKNEKGSKGEKENLIDGDDGPAKGVTKQAGNATGGAKDATKSADGVKSKADGVAGTAKGGVSGATGLG